MKKIIYCAAMATLLMTSCQKTEMLNVVEDTIDFTTHVGKLTKAEDTYSDAKYATLINQGFRVWAVADFTSGSEVTDGKIYRGMNNLHVNYSEDSKKWTLTEKYLWPQAGQYLYFYTLSSSKLTSLSATNFETAPDAPSVASLTISDYIVDDQANDDVMVADHIRQQKKEGGTSTKEVKPEFRHTMTKVVFKFKSGGGVDNGAPEATNVILKGVQTTALDKSGDLVVTYSNATATPATSLTFKWTTDNTEAPAAFGLVSENILTIAKKGGSVIQVVESVETAPTEADKVVVVYTKNNNVIVKASIYKSVAQENQGTPTYIWDVVEEHNYANGAWPEVEANKYETFNGTVLTSTLTEFVTWYMIPQDLGDSDIVTISYVADGKHIDQKFTLQVVKDDAAVADWVEEQCVNYNVTIAPHKIQFSPEVETWVEKDEDLAN